MISHVCNMRNQGGLRKLFGREVAATICHAFGCRGWCYATQTTTKENSMNAKYHGQKEARRVSRHPAYQRLRARCLESEDRYRQMKADRDGLRRTVSSQSQMIADLRKALSEALATKDEVTE